jgi:hypothetical protein
MANEQNLKPRNLTSEEAAELGRKGGIASGKSRREKKQMKETLEILLSLPLNNGEDYDIEQLQNFADIKDKNITVNAAILIKQVQKALKGDNNAINFIRDMVEPKTNNLNISGELPVVIGGENELKD